MDVKIEAVETRIDRLVLDIPGLDPATLQKLVASIAEQLRRAGVQGQHRRDSITVQLRAPGGTTETLAAQIVAAVLERLN